MKYRVESNADEINIEVTETGGKQEELLQAFQECQQGRCSCPTREYSKLESLEITSEADTIKLRLRSKPDAKFNRSAIGKCLEYTRGKVTDGN